MIIKSILDSDLYKFTMGQAIAQKFPNAWARYKFINRGETKFSSAMAVQLRNEVDSMAKLKLTDDERIWLKRNCSYLNPVYIDLLNGYQYDPNEVYINYKNNELEVQIEGPWYRTVYWEVPLMALISELYNRENKQPNKIDLDISREKALKLAKQGCYFADFGTRRRFSRQHHQDITWQLNYCGGRYFVGTSNVAIAKKFKIKPIGTQAHEWFMFHGAKYGYREANRTSLKHWVNVYHGNLGIALTDTFGTNDFFKAFGSKYSKLFDGVRHDSGNPFEFANKVIAHYNKMGIDPMSKTIVFSDGLNVDKAIELKNHCEDKIKCSFGIGTNFTNNISHGADPLNIVIKMTHCKPYGESEELPVVKLSDHEGKHTGASEEIELCKKTLRL